jgi:ferrochelatase
MNHPLHEPITLPKETIGVLLMNLGTPTAPTPKAVRRYLADFLSDPRVVELPKIIWLPILYGVILPFRSAASAKKYSEIWQTEGSPLRLISQAQCQSLQNHLNASLLETDKTQSISMDVRLGFSYGDSTIAEQMRYFETQGIKKIVLLPLYPQYAGSSTGASFQAVFDALSHQRYVPALSSVASYAEHPLYIESLAASVRQHWAHHGRGALLLMSFHGIPQRSVDLGDPYPTHCWATARALAAALGLAEDEYRVTFQSRLGKAQWLRPYTDKVLEALGAAKLPTLDVICPGFLADCLETLHEIGIEGRELFEHAGGGELRYISCLNDTAAAQNLILALAQSSLAAWMPR